MKILSCDWGTSNFRLYLIESENGACLHQLSTNDGIGPLMAKKDKEEAALGYFLNHLKAQIAIIVQSTSTNLQGIPVLISGMASSSIGMKELAYAKLPFRISGEDLVWEKIPSTINMPHDIYLLSGLASENDVMRGEETQLVGMQNQFSFNQSVFLLPGTHSKHIYIENKKVTQFSTFMTGELFHISATHSILSHTVQASAIEHADAMAAFKNGVHLAKEKNYLEALFKVRTNTLLQGLAPQLNYCFLSGLHIGYELKTLIHLPRACQIIICGGAQLSLLYRVALDQFDLQNQSDVIPAATASMATVFGHLAILPALIAD
ncbi:MAG: 2-dehydro-3-deoxygalactonokinase [Saprospiraceae bacterium]